MFSPGRKGEDEAEFDREEGHGAPDVPEQASSPSLQAGLRCLPGCDPKPGRTGLFQGSHLIVQGVRGQGGLLPIGQGAGAGPNAGRSSIQRMT